MGRRLSFEVGDRHGFLVLKQAAPPYVSPRGAKKQRVLCLCDCGRETLAILSDVKRGHTHSCGCGLSSSTHGHCRNWKHGRQPEYQAWVAIKERCFNENCVSYRNYGGRGITVCKGWVEDFDAFLAYVGPRPTCGHSLDRIDNNGHYAPGNVRWATRKEQALNRRSNVRVTVDGVTKTITEWVSVSPFVHGTISQRLRAGWSPHEAVFGRNWRSSVYYQEWRITKDEPEK